MLWLCFRESKKKYSSSLGEQNQRKVQKNWFWKWRTPFTSPGWSWGAALQKRQKMEWVSSQWGMIWGGETINFFMFSTLFFFDFPRLSCLDSLALKVCAVFILVVFQHKAQNNLSGIIVDLLNVSYKLNYSLILWFCDCSISQYRIINEGFFFVFYFFIEINVKSVLYMFLQACAHLRSGHF